jgi:hypothetical protein
MKRNTANSGFIALISILIVSAVLLATTLGLAQFGLANRFFIMHLEQKASSEKLAEGCVQMARIKIYNDPSFSVATSMTPFTIADGTCTIYAITPNTPSNGQSRIRARATSGESVTNLEVVVNTANGTFVSWTEVGKF